MKILCLCEGGNTRSVTAATMLKYHWKHDALAASVTKNQVETLRMLVDWSDEILCVSPEIHRILCERLDWCIGESDSIRLIRVLDIDEDRWGMSMHPDLIPRMHALLTDAYGPQRSQKTVAEILAKREKYEQRRREAAARGYNE